LARKIGGNLSPERVLFCRHHVGISRPVRDDDTLLHSCLLDGELNADGVEFLRLMADNDTAHLSMSGNIISAAKEYVEVGAFKL